MRRSWWPCGRLSASSLMWRTGHEIDVPVPQVMEELVAKQETVEELGKGREERRMPEIIIVSDAVDGISPREPVQQRTPEQIEDVPEFREETADVVELVSQDNSRTSRRQSRWAGWSCMNEYSALPRKKFLRFGSTFPRSASRSVHRSSVCQCRRFPSTFPNSASRSVHRSSVCLCRRFWSTFPSSASRLCRRF